jgi:hypothetical protein
LNAFDGAAACSRPEGAVGLLLLKPEWKDSRSAIIEDAKVQQPQIDLLQQYANYFQQVVNV